MKIHISHGGEWESSLQIPFNREPPTPGCCAARLPPIGDELGALRAVRMEQRTGKVGVLKQRRLRTVLPNHGGIWGIICRQYAGNEWVIPYHPITIEHLKLFWVWFGNTGRPWLPLWATVSRNQNWVGVARNSNLNSIFIAQLPKRRTHPMVQRLSIYYTPKYNNNQQYTFTL